MNDSLKSTVGEVFAYNHYPARLAPACRAAIEAEYLDTPDLRELHNQRLKRDRQRDEQLKSFVQKLSYKAD